MATDQPGRGKELLSTGGSSSSDAADLSAAYRSREVAEAWQRGAAARAGTLGPVTETMLDLAGVGLSSRVLDVAAGTGEQTLLAARRVGPDGFVLAVDIAPEMLEVASGAARVAGLSNVETRVMDAQQLTLAPDSFDAAICRSGLMLMTDPIAALVGIRAALKPGGTLAALVFGPAARNPLQALPTLIARRAAGVPPPGPGEPGMFALGEPGTLEAAFRAAGFRDVAVRTIATTRRFPSAAQAVQSLRDSLPSIHAVLARVDDAGREQAWTEIERALARFDGTDGFVAPGELLIGVGTK